MNSGYKSNFSTEAITELANAWSAMGATFAEQLGPAEDAVRAMQWRGDAQQVVIGNWEVIETMQLAQVPEACNQIAEALNQYAAGVQQYQAQMKANALASA